HPRAGLERPGAVEPVAPPGVRGPLPTLVRVRPPRGASRGRARRPPTLVSRGRARAAPPTLSPGVCGRLDREGLVSETPHRGDHLVRRNASPTRNWRL